MRVNARLDENRARKLKQLQSLTHLGTSEIVKQAIDLLHRQQTEKPRASIKALLASDFVGCAEGPRDLSSRYKSYLANDLENKHGVG